MKQNGFPQKIVRGWRYPVKTINDSDYADDLALLSNTPTQAKSRLHSLEQTTRGISLYLNPDKTDFMSFNQDVAIS